VASVWISGGDHQAAFAIVCLRFVITLDCYCSLFIDRVVRAVVEAKCSLPAEIRSETVYPLFTSEFNSNIQIIKYGLHFFIYLFFKTFSSAY